MLDKWKRAAVHLECAADSEDYYDRIKRVDELLERGKKQPLAEEAFDELMHGVRDVRFHGTAIFIADAGRRYLLTARHVVFDEISAAREFQARQKEVEGGPGSWRERDLEGAAARAKNTIFNMIFRVPSLDDVIGGRRSERFLMNLGAGPSSMHPYTFSEEYDLAIISLDQRDSAFANELVERGHEPLSLDDLADGPYEEGQELCAIGYPSATALVGELSLRRAMRNWSSNHFSLPVSSFGRVSMLHEALPFFWADISIYPGNSGGLVIADGRLVGIVSAQAIVPLDSMPNVSARVPFGMVIKAGLARSLLNSQKVKDGLWRR